MRSYALNEARASFSKVFERALAGEPQRITRYGKEAVVVLAEKDWAGNHQSSGISGEPTLADLFAKLASGGDADELFGRSHFADVRPLGSDFDTDH
jgi:prevent-host-death family protein